MDFDQFVTFPKSMKFKQSLNVGQFIFQTMVFKFYYKFGLAYWMLLRNASFQLDISKIMPARPK